MRPASLKHLLTKPALLVAAGLVLLGAAAGGALPGPRGGPASSGGDAACRTAKPSFDALCRCFGATLTSEDEGGFAHAGLHAAFDPAGVCPVETGSVRCGHGVHGSETSRSRLRRCAVGPSPPGATGTGV